MNIESEEVLLQYIIDNQKSWNAWVIDDVVKEHNVLATYKGSDLRTYTQRTLKNFKVNLIKFLKEQSDSTEVGRIFGGNITVQQNFDIRNDYSGEVDKNVTRSISLSCALTNFKDFSFNTLDITCRHNGVPRSYGDYPNMKTNLGSQIYLWESNNYIYNKSGGPSVISITMEGRRLVGAHCIFTKYNELVDSKQREIELGNNAYNLSGVNSEGFPHSVEGPAKFEIQLGANEKCVETKSYHLNNHQFTYDKWKAHPEVLKYKFELFLKED